MLVHFTFAMVSGVLVLALLKLGASEDPLDADVYMREPTTVKGCKCKSGCDSSLLFECAAAEFCVVESKDCQFGEADWSLTRLAHYDYCVYPAYAPYEEMSAAQKQSILLSKVNDQSSGSFPGKLGVLTGIIGESVMTTFDSNSDTFPAERTKYIHSVGVTGGISFISSGDHQYAGLFQGAEHGVVRFSSAKEPASGDGFTPGMGVKFLRDGRKSANFVSMWTLDGQPCEERNFFQHDWSNHVDLTDNFGLKLISQKFWQASRCPIKVGLSDMASDADDVPAARGSFPFQLVFKPVISSDCDCTNYDSCLMNLANIPVGTKMFDVEALAYPDAAAQRIGEITLTSALQRSRWGDEVLFFQHQRMEDDFAIHSEWLDVLDLPTDCGMSCGATRPTVEQGCTNPFDGSNNTAMLETDVQV